mgnify:FL=1
MTARCAEDKMIRLINEKTCYLNGTLTTEKEAISKSVTPSTSGTIAHEVLCAHNLSNDEKKLNIRFDAMASHDITYVGIIQSAKASGLKEFPLPYVLTNCHNSLCAVGGTINEDDHVFGLSCAKKYGGIYVPANVAVIHSYMREMFAGCGKMILGSDSHTRYGALGTLAIGEGGPELVKQLLKRTYDIDYPRVIAVELKGKVRKGVGPQDVALALIGEVFKSGFVRNAVLEFVGEGINGLSVEFRNGIDVMTTESACLSSIWCTDEKVKEYLSAYGREDDYRRLQPKEGASYDGGIVVDLSKVEPMIALPFHPSNVYKLADVIANPYEILSKAEKEGNELLGLHGEYKLTDKIKDGKIVVSQGVIAGCAGGIYDNLVCTANILKGKRTGDGAFSLSVYPGSQPTNLALVKNGAIASLIESGTILKPCFCGPCFGAGDVPCNNGFSIRHTTRNFERREGSKPSDKQIASVALMDARSIAATAANGGVLTSALGLDFDDEIPKFEYNPDVYASRVYNGYGKADNGVELVYGPNITDIPHIEPMKTNVALKLCSVIDDPVTTTDELIPSGETSSYRSNPLRLAEFALSRKDPQYVGASKLVRDGNNEDVKEAIALCGLNTDDTTINSCIFARKPGDGSAREQAASCQRFLGGGANIAREYATKRYRSNLINWGMLPLLDGETEYKKGDIVVIKGAKDSVLHGKDFDAYLVREGKAQKINIRMDALTDAERQIIADGCLINYYKRG